MIRRLFYNVIVKNYSERIMQSAGDLMFSSIVTEPISSAVMLPDVGFLILVIAPLMQALRVLYSKALSQSGPNVQFSITRLWA